MSTQRDIERVLDAWLATGPTEMPDRVFHDALDRIERVPQRRAAWPTRFPAMFSMSKLPLAAAVAALAIGIATAPLWLGPGGDGPASQAPAASPAVPAAAEATPSDAAEVSSPDTTDAVQPALEGSWAAGPRSIPGLDLLDTIAAWRIQDGLFSLVFPGTQLLGSTLGSQVTADGPNLRLENRLGGQGCPAGSVGTYSWSISDHLDTTVTLQALHDDCTARAAFLDGTWSRTSCDLEWNCTGRLQAGRYRSAIFDPRASSEPRVARPGAVSYEVPQGWANANDWLSSLMLVPDAGYQRLLDDPTVWPDQITMWSTPVTALTLPGPECTLFRADPEGGSSVESLSAWLERHPDLAVQEPQPITIDGHAGLVIDLDMTIDADTVCPAAFDGGPGVPLFGSATDIRPDGMHVSSSEQGGWDFGAGGICPDCTSDPQRIILLDLDGEPLVILVDSEKPEDQAAFVERAMPIVESFRFPE